MNGKGSSRRNMVKCGWNACLLCIYCEALAKHNQTYILSVWSVEARHSNVECRNKVEDKRREKTEEVEGSNWYSRSARLQHSNRYQDHFSLA